MDDIKQTKMNINGSSQLPAVTCINKNKMLWGHAHLGVDVLGVEVL